MKHYVCEETKTVYFQGDWPSVMGIPHIMKNNYPGYNHKVVNHNEFRKNYDKTRQS